MAISVELTLTNGVRVGNVKDLYFTSDGGVEGEISICDPLKIGFDLVKISLEGVLLNSIRYTEQFSKQHRQARKLQMLLRMSDIKKRSDFVRSTVSGKSVVRCSFCFHVPQCLGRKLLGEDAEYLSDLPASILCLDAATEGQTCSGESRTIYAVRVDVIQRETTVGTDTMTINILPSLRPRPPICLTHFGSEYSTRSTKPIRGKGRFTLSKIGSCTVTTVEPEAVVLKRPNDPFTVSVPLRFILEPNSVTSDTSRRSKRDQVQFQQLAETILQEPCECSGALIASTFISVIPRRGVPTRAEADKARSLTKNFTVCSRTTTNLSLSGTDIRQQKSGRYECNVKAELHFNEFKRNEPILPSFDSSLISHRYRLGIKIQLGTANRVSNYLDIPISVRYCSRSNDDPPPFHEVPPLPDSTSDAAVPISPAPSLEEQFTSMQIEGMFRNSFDSIAPDEQSRPILPTRIQQDLELMAYNHRNVSIEAPPYVV